MSMSGSLPGSKKGSIMKLNRRQLLLAGLGGAGAAFLGFASWYQAGESVPDFLLTDDWHFFEEKERLILSVIVPVLLSESLLEGRLEQQLRRMDEAVSYLSATQQRELRELMNALESKVSRVILSGSLIHWNNISPEAVDALLESWRDSYLDLLKQAYAGLKELTYAAWYGTDDSWQLLGYDGPLRVKP